MSHTVQVVRSRNRSKQFLLKYTDQWITNHNLIRFPKDLSKSDPYQRENLNTEYSACTVFQRKREKKFILQSYGATILQTEDSSCIDGSVLVCDHRAYLNKAFWSFPVVPKGLLPMHAAPAYIQWRGTTRPTVYWPYHNNSVYYIDYDAMHWCACFPKQVPCLWCTD